MSSEQSRHCEKCAENWPKHLLKCPICGAKSEPSDDAPMPEWEYQWMLYTGGKRIIDALPKGEQERCDKEWQALEEEAKRRGENWTVPDLIEEKFGSVRS